MLQSLTSPTYFSDDEKNGGFLLKHGVGNYPRHADINVPLIYADYYFIEAIARYKGWAVLTNVLLLQRM